MQANANTIRPTVADLIGQWPTAHWVRCHPDKTPVNAKGWQRQRLHADVVTSWAATGNPVAIIPGSVGYVALDVDAGDAGRMIAELPPAYACPSRRPGGMHLWYPHDGEPVGNRRWELFGCSGEVRGHRGYLILWNPDGLIGAPAHNATAWDVVENMIGRRAGSATPEVTHTGDTTDATGALDAIPADLPGYDNFLAVVIAAKASGIEAETVRTWTEGARDDQDGRRNKLSQWAAFWDGLTPTAIGPGTLFHFARQHGYTRPTNFWTTPVESSPEVGRDLLAMDWERCPTYAKFRLTDFRGGAAVKGWGCGEDPVCRRNKHRRDWGKPYAAGVGAVVTDVLIRGGFDMALGKGSPFSNLRNAHRAIRDIGAVAMLGPGFSQRVILAGVVDDLDAHLDYLRGQVGVKEVTATTGEPQTFAALYGWMGEREEWHYKKQRWRFYGWAVKKLPQLRGLYSDGVANATDDDTEITDTLAVTQLKAEVAAAAPGKPRAAAVKLAELTIVGGYIERGADLPKVWIRALTDAAGRLSCVQSGCGCAITDRGRKRHINAAKRCWTPAMIAAAGYVGTERLRQLSNMALR